MLSPVSNSLLNGNDVLYYLENGHFGEPCHYKYTLAAALPGGVSRQPCLLCEEHPAIIKFSPCGHTVLCSRCAERAKRCLQCKVSKDVITSSSHVYVLVHVVYMCRQQCKLSKPLTIRHRELSNDRLDTINNTNGLA